MNQLTIVAILVGVLVIASAVQAVQLNSLKDKIANAPVAKAGAASSSVSTASGAPRAPPASVSDLPSMVGGC